MVRQKPQTISSSLLKDILIHELGHAQVSRELGYVPFKFMFDLHEGIFFVGHLKRPLNLKTLEDELTMTLAGRAAEEITGRESPAWLYSDGKDAFNFLKRLHQLKNKPFSYSTFSDNLEIYKEHTARAKQILLNSGGKDFLEGLADVIWAAYGPNSFCFGVYK